MASCVSLRALELRHVAAVELEVLGGRQRPRARARANASGTSASLRPQTNRLGPSSSGRRVQKPSLAVRLLEVDVARRGVERRAAAGLEVRAQELVDAGGGPAVGRRPGRRAARSPRRSAAARAGRARAAAGRAAAAAPTAGSRSQASDGASSASRDARSGCSSATSSATRPPMLLPTSAASSRSSASSSATTARAKNGASYAARDRLDRVAEARAGRRR